MQREIITTGDQTRFTISTTKEVRKMNEQQEREMFKALEVQAKMLGNTERH